MAFCRSKLRFWGLTLAVAVAISPLGSVPADAQSSYRAYCHDLAQRLSGYRGQPGNVIGGAVGGAFSGAILSGILGGNAEDRRRAAGVGALLGGISNANRPNSRAARIYRLEFNDCMRRR